MTGPDGEVDSRISDLVDTGNLCGWAGHRGSRASLNLELSTNIVKLGLLVMGSVESNVLNTGEVFAVGDGVGDLEGDLVLAPHAPSVVAEGFVTGVAADERLLDPMVYMLAFEILLQNNAKRLGVCGNLLDPISRTIVALDTARSPAHVDLSRTRVLHASDSIRTPNSNGVSRPDRVDISVGTVSSTLIATEVVLENLIPLRWHVSASMLTNVLPRASSLLVVDPELVEGVVGTGHGKETAEDDEVELHLGDVVG